MAMGLLVVLFLAVTARLFIWPPTDQPTHADAVVALGGDPGQLRAKEAIKLAAEGYAPNIVESIGEDGHCIPVTFHATVICFRADPYDTRGEAEYVARLARRRHWNTLIIVPERSQVTRARLLFERCTDVRLEWVPVTDPISHLFYDVVYEWGSLGKALLIERSC